jgi:hypothetical protein
MPITKLFDTRGIGLGYAADGFYFLNTNPSVARKITAPTAPPPPKPKIDFLSLRRTIYDDGECPYCFSYPNTQTVLTKTDKGPKALLRCAKCQKLFLPFKL